MIFINPISQFGAAGDYQNYQIELFKVTPSEAEPYFFLDTRKLFVFIISAMDLSVCTACGDLINVIFEVTDTVNAYSSRVTFNLQVL